MNRCPNSSPQLNPTDQDEIKLSGEEPILFDWQNRWLKGHEYSFILKNIDAYCARYGFAKLDYKTHPSSIYENPIDGMIYFVKGTGVGSDFGFPRISQKKRYRWKKMNFTTDLPKKRPHVTYVVVSASTTFQIQGNSEILNFRMHAVIPSKNRLKQYQKPADYILCHVRRIEKKIKVSQGAYFNNFVNKNFIDYYELFIIMHNFSLKTQKIDNFSH